MKFLFQAAVLSSMAAWLLVAERFALDGVLNLCLQTDPIYTNARSNTMCAVACVHKKCTVFSFQDGVCKLCNVGDDVTSGNNRLFRPATNVAVNGPVTASAHYASLAPELANDGDRLTFYHSSYGQLYAWWNVDLRRPVYIHVVHVVPPFHDGAIMYRFHHVEVSVGMDPAVGGDASAYTVLGLFVGPFSNSSCCSVDFSLGSPILARYVHVRRTTANEITQDYLIMNEVEVMVS